MKTVTITVIHATKSTMETSTVLVDANAFAHIIAGYVIEGYSVRKTMNGKINAEKGNVMHIISSPA